MAVVHKQSLGATKAPRVNKLHTVDNTEPIPERMPVACQVARTDNGTSLQVH